jgi:hypothetical protein
MAIRCKMRLDNVFRQQWGGIKAFFSCTYDQKLADQRGVICLPVTPDLRPVAVGEIPF